MVVLLISGRQICGGDTKPTVEDTNVAVDNYVNRLQAEGLANHAQATDDEPLSDDEEELLYKLYKQGYLNDYENDNTQQAAAPTNTASQEIELDLEAPDSIDEEALEQLMQEMEEQQQIAREQKQPSQSPGRPQAPMPIQVTQEHATPAPPVKAIKKTMHKNNGEAEFETFIDPVIVGGNVQRKENPSVNVKRAQELHFGDSNGSGANGNLIFMGVVGICATVAMAGTVVAGTAYYKLHAQTAAAQSASDMHTVSGPAKDRMRKAVQRGDQKNAYSAQLHHYQQTKNEIIRIEQQGGHAREQDSEDDSEAGDEPDYSVYECPGLAPTGDIEVANPMFDQGKK
jgi:ribosomal protein S8